MMIYHLFSLYLHIEGASVSACDDTISKVDGGSFLYFRTEFVSVTGGISVEVRDTKGNLSNEACEQTQNVCNSITIYNAHI